MATMYIELVDGKILNARVQQKTGPQSDFAGYTLLDGEIALVRSSPTGPVIQFKVGPGVFDDLDWSLPSPGAAQKADTSTVFPAGVPGLYIPIESGTIGGVPVDLNAGYTQLIWDGANLVDVVFPIDLAGYVAKDNLSTKGLLSSATIEDGAVASGGGYVATSGAKRVRFLPLPPGDYILDGVVANSIKYFSFRTNTDTNTGSVLNLGTIPFRFTIPSAGVEGISFTIKAPDEPNDDSITNAVLTPVEPQEDGVPLTYNGKNVYPLGLSKGNYVPDPMADNNAVNRKWVEDVAMSVNDGVLTNQGDISNSPEWTWTISGGAASVTDLSGIWDAVLLDPSANGISFVIQHQRVWAVLGYNSATALCAVGVAGSTNIFGQVVNIDLSTDTFTVVQAGGVLALPTGSEVTISIASNSINMYKGQTLSKVLSIDVLRALGANLDTITFGLAGANFSSSIADGAVLASSLKSLIKVPLSNKIAALPNTSGLKGFVLGDSISTSSYGGLVDGQIWWQLVAAHLGANFTANAVSGTPIAEKSGFNSFVTDARWQDADLDTDIYIIEGGINDFGAREIPLGMMGSTNKTDFYGALRYLFTGVAARYPRAKIFYMTPLHTYNYGFPATNGTTGLTLQEYVDAARQMCDIVGVTLVDTYQKSGITYQNMSPVDSPYTTDGLHPNAAGHVQMANVVQREIELHF